MEGTGTDVAEGKERVRVVAWAMEGKYWPGKSCDVKRWRVRTGWAPQRWPRITAARCAAARKLPSALGWKPSRW